MAPQLRTREIASMNNDACGFSGLWYVVTDTGYAIYERISIVIGFIFARLRSKLSRIPYLGIVQVTFVWRAAPAERT
ncbi:unnamed protein product [Danaus chrysippus]|uniref:(African queen) hypothetical protein n=1 Tax=Danaus chrysippus TaxID=151541 RepID=A0A8J2QKY2_9NEOP|nr:unnamed protein product [Danaus chrysippus]